MVYISHVWLGHVAQALGCIRKHLFSLSFVVYFSYYNRPQDNTQMMPDWVSKGKKVNLLSYVRLFATPWSVAY